MSDREMEIRQEMLAISKAVDKLKEYFNDTNTTLYEMSVIMDNARLLNCTDFVKTITD